MKHQCYRSANFTFFGLLEVHPLANQIPSSACSSTTLSVVTSEASSSMSIYEAITTQILLHRYLITYFLVSFSPL